MRVQHEPGIGASRVDPSRQQGADGIVQRRLASLLTQSAGGSEQRQSLTLRQMPHVEVVVILVGRFEDRRRRAVGDRQQQVDEQDRR